MSSRIEWHGEEAKDHVHRRAVQFLVRAAIEVKREAQKLLSVAGTGVMVKDGLSDEFKAARSARRRRKVTRLINKGKRKLSKAKRTAAKLNRKAKKFVRTNSAIKRIRKIGKRRKRRRK